jgi:hypothetical protein
MIRPAVVVLALAAAPGDRPAAAILRDYDAVSYPSFSDGSDPESIARFRRAIDDASHHQEALALELLAAHPRHERVPELLRRRWQLLVNVDHDFARVHDETTRLVRAASDERLVPVARAVGAWACVDDERLPFERRRAEVEGALEVAPSDELVQSAYVDLARRHSCDVAFQRQAVARILELDREGRGARDFAGSLGRTLDRVGRTADAELVDAPTGRAFTLASLRGHPVLITFFPLPDSDQEGDEAATLRRFAAAFAPRDLEIVSVHATFGDGDEAGRRAALAKLELPGRRHLDTRPFDATLEKELAGATEVPLSLLLDAQGRLVALTFRTAALEPALARLPMAAKRRPI